MPPECRIHPRTAQAPFALEPQNAGEDTRSRFGAYEVWKSALDFALAAILLVLASPLIAFAALLVKLTSRGPAFYSQVRMGRHGRPYRIHKIRTMAHDCERHSGPRWATARDPRITLVGRFLRRTHLDELPQLWNVLRGDMSLVGPRPERPEFLPRLEQAIPRYRERLLVRPGMTGLAQVQLPPDTDLDSVRRKLAYDLYYIQRSGLWLDLRLLMATVCYVLHLPFPITRKLLGIPSGKRVEGRFRSVKLRPEEVPAVYNPCIHPELV
jgi:lipopolysaccharide/colanic/teichoic acid biosynthesis glycosyltransferase